MMIKKLSEIASIEISGVDKKSNPSEPPVKLLNFTDVYYNWQVDSRDSASLMKATAKQDEITKFSVKNGDIAITKDSETRYDIGIPCLVDDDLSNVVLGYHCALIRPKKEMVDSGYLNAYLNSSMARKYFSNQASGSGQRYTLTIDGIGAVKVLLPTLDEQHNTSSLIGAINKKIKLNNRINDNLHQLCTCIFDYSFGKKHPNGFLSSIVSEQPKSTVQANEVNGVNGDYPFFTSGESVNQSNSYLVDGLNCFLSTGGNASIKIYFGKASYSTDTWCIYGKNGYSPFLYFFLKSIKKSINTSYFAGSGLKYLQKEALLKIKMYVPSLSENIEFNQQVEPLLKRMSDLMIENQKLIKFRTFILPLLMNGQAIIAD